MTTTTTTTTEKTIRGDSAWCCILPAYCAPTPAEPWYLSGNYAKTTLAGISCMVLVACATMYFFDSRRLPSRRWKRKVSEGDNSAMVGGGEVIEISSFSKLGRFVRNVTCQTAKYCKERGRNRIGGGEIIGGGGCVGGVGGSGGGIEGKKDCGGRTPAQRNNADRFGTGSRPQPPPSADRLGLKFITDAVDEFIHIATEVPAADATGRPHADKAPSPPLPSPSRNFPNSAAP